MGMEAIWQGKHGLQWLLRIQRQTAGIQNWRPAVALAAFIDRPASCSSNRRQKQKNPSSQIRPKRVQEN